LFKDLNNLKVEELVEIGEIDPNDVHLPGIYVDRLVVGQTFEKRIEVCNFKFFKELLD